MEEAGLPYNQILHQHLAEPYRWELKAGGMRGTDPRHLFLYGNHQGSTVQVRDGDGRGALRLDYSPFGQVFLKHSDRHHWSPADSSASTLEQLGNLMPYQYTGRYTEAATGLVHLDARWYNPHTQRFMQPDLWNFRNTGLPSEIQHELMRFTGLDTAQLLRDPSQQVAYGYVSGNPLAWTDWLGLCYPEALGIEPINSYMSAGSRVEVYANGTVVSHNPNMAITPKEVPVNWNYVSGAANSIGAGLAAGVPGMQPVAVYLGYQAMNDFVAGRTGRGTTERVVTTAASILGADEVKAEAIGKSVATGMDVTGVFTSPLKLTQTLAQSAAKSNDALDVVLDITGATSEYFNGLKALEELE